MLNLFYFMEDLSNIYLNFHFQEKRLCNETKIPAQIYLKMQEIIAQKVFSGHVTTNVDAHCLFNMEPNKIDRIYDMLIRKGIAPP